MNEADMSEQPAALVALVQRHPELDALMADVIGAFTLLATTFEGGGTLYVGGNGGSASDAEHIVGELMKGMERRRPVPDGVRAGLSAAAPSGLEREASYLAEHLERALRSVSLVSQTSLLSAVANDTAGDMAMAQQVHGYGRSGDLFWALSTSGRSRNVVLAALAARERGMKVLALTGEPGEPLGRMADVWIRVPAPEVARAQEMHQAVYHALCAALENHFFC